MQVLALVWRCRGGQRVSDRTGEGWMDSGHPPLCDQGSQSQTSRVGQGAMNAGLCPVRGHHIPLEPLCGAQQSGGEGRPGHNRTGLERKHRPESVDLSYCHQTPPSHQRCMWFCVVGVISFGDTENISSLISSHPQNQSCRHTVESMDGPSRCEK